ncbi:uncharacterized protein SCDLUD_000755 [Saccharomycodes ludwigii]|uniref:uncharacterized protein n=1 Tax=Saccharomycodes ludwigii TaxID=36035 RepID=UPI001E8B4B8B|nr:hypothetical protein SCDLUD_000755 [Saccharomycodes ludwigii]KAH3903142.1 hypothetical protein SCDLUD_000755 [Saccharomycodes ludwigii]
MGKSLRAKSTIKAKAFRRKELEYQNAVDSRAKRIAEKLKQDLNKQSNKEDSDVMEVEQTQQTEKSNISTSGWRDARHLNYRKAKKMKKSKKKGSFTKF